MKKTAALLAVLATLALTGVASAASPQGHLTGSASMGLAPQTYNIICAHFVGNRKMAFDYLDTTLGAYVVVYIVDGNPSVDRAYVGRTTGSSAADATLAMQWVNRGWAGSGARTAGFSFDFADPAGDYSVEA
jgi:hypothetical protein